MLLGKVCDKINREYKCLVEILFKQSRELHCESLKLIQKYYSPTAKRATNEDKIVICMFDGKMRHGGLSDRLRGMISGSSHKNAKTKCEYVSFGFFI